MTFLDSDEKRKMSAWLRASEIPGHDGALWRRDRFGSAIHWPHHGNRDSDYGWEIDHQIPKARGGLGFASNLEALHWRNNVAKSDSLV